MNKKTTYFELVSAQKFSASSNAAKLIKTGNVSDQELAMAVKSTKAYKENAEIKKATDEALKGGTAEKAPKKEDVQQTEKGGERRRY